MKSGKHYCLLVLSWTTLCLGLIAAFNWAIDPYQLHDTAEHNGLNTKKTEIFFQLGMTKAYQFYNSDASSLILGSSRAGRAIDPNHPLLSGQHFYNFATPGTLPRQDYLKLRAAIATRKINRVIYCVDFFTFNDFYTLPASYNEEFSKRMSLNDSAWRSPAFVQQAIVDYGANFWSYHTLRDSILTIRNQEDAESGRLQYTVLDDDGLWELVLASNRQLLNAFGSMERSYLRETWFPPYSHRFSLNKNEAAPNTAFDDFKALLALAHANGIETTIVVLPVHARLLETLAYAGLWENFEYWKRQLVILNEEVARSGGHLPFDIWDFNGYYPTITEQVSGNIDAGPLTWFYDSAHPSVNTGNRILDIVAGKSPADFGGRIDSNNIDSWLRRQRDLRDAYRAAYPAQAKRLRNTVNKIRKQFPWDISPVPGSELVVDKFADSKHSH
jgi:hypothetical protein